MTPADLQALNVLSEKIGTDPSLVQGAGGNTSIKIDDLMWIKASGTWLSQALEREIMVPVDMARLLQAVHDGDSAADKAQQFVPAQKNPDNLRPSIETTLHAVMPQRIVVHVHCVETIALAVREDAAQRLDRDFGDGVDLTLVPYARPGLPLSREMLKRKSATSNVIVLGNHGLVVAADTLEQVEQLLTTVSTALRQRPRSAPAADLAALKVLAQGTEYRLPQFEDAHGVATDPVSCAVAGGGSLYPDHVIFLGPGSVVAGADDTVASLCRRETDAGLPEPVSLLFPGKGVLMHERADAGAEAMAKCLSDVTARIDEQAAINYLSMDDTAQLLNWDAEQYRQSLNARPEFKVDQPGQPQAAVDG